MKVLLDENLPHRLRTAFSEHEVYTAQYMGWSGISNGKLLALLEREGFDVLLTADQPLQSQQNPAGRRIAIVCLTSQEWPLLVPHLDLIFAAVNTAQPGSYRRVDCGTFSRSG